MPEFSNVEPTPLAWSLPRPRGAPLNPEKAIEDKRVALGVSSSRGGNLTRRIKQGGSGPIGEKPSELVATELRVTYPPAPRVPSAAGRPPSHTRTGHLRSAEQSGLGLRRSFNSFDSAAEMYTSGNRRMAASRLSCDSRGVPTGRPSLSGPASMRRVPSAPSLRQRMSVDGGLWRDNVHKATQVSCVFCPSPASLRKPQRRRSLYLK